MLKKLVEEVDAAPAAATSPPVPRSPATPTAAEPRGTRATRRSPARLRVARAAQRDAARRRRRGTSSSTSPQRPRLRRPATPSASSRTTIPSLVEAVIARHRRRPTAPIGGTARCAASLTDASVAGAGAGRAVPAHRLPDRRRAPPEGQGARRRRGSRRRRRHARRAGGAAEVSRPRAADPEALVEALEPLQPRLYSISSSPRANPGRVSPDGRCRALRRSPSGTRLGVASTFSPSGAQPGDTVKVYVQKAHGFALPADPATPIIMVGPGTGVAPFRAFLQERMATKRAGTRLAVLRPSARGDTTSSTRTNSPA